MSRNVLVAALALLVAVASAQTVNTQVNGLVLTNGLTSITDASALNTTNQSVGIAYLTDDDASTFVFNLGINLPSTSAIQGTFAGPLSASSTGIYFVCMSDNGNLVNGPSFDVQLQLAGGLTTIRSYGDANFFVTPQQILTVSTYNNSNGAFAASFAPTWNALYAYLHIPFADFGVTNDQVIGIKLSNFTSQYPDFSFIGAGYAGSPIPEPSTYGLILGGLALAGAAIRRRKSAK
jgi:hypothetical protein